MGCKKRKQCSSARNKLFSIINKIVSAIIGIAVAYAGYGLWALVVSGMSSSLLGLIQTWWVVKWVPKERFSRESFKYLWNYGNKMIGANLVDTIYNNITPIFVGKFYSSRDLGVYNRALGYSILPVNQISGVLSSVTFPVLSKMQENNDLLMRNYRRMIRVSCFIAFPVMMLLSALARPIIIIMISEKWSSCIILLQIMCFSKMWWPMQSINRNLLQVKGRSDYYFRLELIKKSIIFLLLCASLPFGIEIFCWCQILQSMCSVYINTYYTGKLINLGYFQQMKDVIPSFMISAIMMIIVLLFNHYISNLYIQIFAGGIIGVLLYIFLAKIFNFEELKDVKNLLLKK